MSQRAVVRVVWLIFEAIDALPSITQKTRRVLSVCYQCNNRDWTQM